MPSSPVCSCLSCPAHRSGPDRRRCLRVLPVLVDDRRPVGGDGAAAARRRATPQVGAGARRNTRAGWCWTRSSTWSAAGSPGRRCPGVPAAPDRLRPVPALGRAGAWQQIHDALRDLVALHAGRARCRPRRSSTRSRCAAPTPSPPRAAATTPARRSTAANATSPSTPAVCCWPSWSPSPPSRTATPGTACWPRCAAGSPRSAWSGPTPATPAPGHLGRHGPA